MKTIFYLPGIMLSALLLNSCGEPDSESELEWENRQFEMEAEGAYMGTINPINNSVGGPISGSVTLNRDEKNLVAYVRISGGQPGVSHQQKIHAGFSCPGTEFDVNADGYLDAAEAMDHVQGVLIPLDGQIGNQAAGYNVWPVGDQYGNYWYEKSAPYTNFINDLRRNDPNLRDDLVKLEDKKLLNLDSRVIMIYGAGPEVALPATVGRTGNLSRNQSLPIACGVLRKVSMVPGTVENDPNIGLPVGPDEISGGNGGDDGAVVPVGTGGAAGGDIGTEEDDDEGGFRWPWESESDGDDWPWTPTN